MRPLCMKQCAGVRIQEWYVTPALRVFREISVKINKYTFYCNDINVYVKAKEKWSECYGLDRNILGDVEVKAKVSLEALVNL